MTIKLGLVRCSLPFLVLLANAPSVLGQTSGFLPPAQTQALVDRALSAELRSAQDHAHPMRYWLRKSSPRLTSTKEILETRDGDVARLVSINDKPLSAADAAKEQARLDSLLSDPGKQRRRKQSEDDDTGRALKVLRALPRAFLYRPAGGDGKIEKFSFIPNPSFAPPDLETQVLTAMSGELWIDTAQERVVRLEGHLQHDVDFGWGILGRLYKGGSVVIEQADVGAHRWRIVRFQMVMSGRVLLKNKTFDTTEQESQFVPVPASIDYRQGIQMLRGGPTQASR